nr:unnamed protein product [Callosobruchus chinensis]
MDEELSEDCMDEESKGSSVEEDGIVTVNQTAQIVPPKIVVQQQGPIIQAPTAAVQHAIGSIVTDAKPDQIPAAKGIAKLVVTNHPSVTTCGSVLQKVVNPPLITVLNPSGPLTVVKSLCVTSGVSSAPQFTLVNSGTNAALGKSPTITLLNGPLAVVKAITTTQPVTQSVEKNGAETENMNTTVTTVPAIIENRGHNVFVKNTCPDTATVPEIPQSHKLLTAANFPQTTVLTGLNAQQKTVNGQRSKLKILSNVVVPGTSNLSNNVLVNKPAMAAPLVTTPTQQVAPVTAAPQQLQQRYVPRQKMIGPNGAPQTKYLNKSGPNSIKNASSANPTTLKLVQEKSSTRMVYPTHKGQIKTIPPVNNYIQKNQQGIKTLSPQHKGIPGQVQRTGTGLRTIPPQRPTKGASTSGAKPNYIGKHAVQAHKAPGGRPPSQHHAPQHHHPHKLKAGGGQPSAGAATPAGSLPLNPYGSPPPPPPPGDKRHISEMTFNQALTAQIIETLSSGGGGGTAAGLSGGGPLSGNAQSHYEIMPTRYHNAFSCPEPKQISEQSKAMEDKNKSGLDALSLICQAVLLDHNYNATLPPESPTRPSPPINMTSQVNGLSTTSVYSAGNAKRRPLVSSNSATTNISTLSSVTCVGSANVNNLSARTQPEVDDDDAGSDISDGSDRKHDTEGEETDTAPEAEAVSNENFDGYGDYVTRCICGYLHDDGYMVECDRCKVWQHVQCVVKNRQVPDEFLCEVCDPRKPVDRQRARTLQQQWLRERQLIVAAQQQQQQQQSAQGGHPHQQSEATGGIGGISRRKEKVSAREAKMAAAAAAAAKETVSETDSSDGEHPVHNNHPSKSRLPNKRKENSQIKNTARQRREAAKEAAQRRQKRKDRKIVRKKVCKTKAQVKSHSDDENQDTWSSQLPQLRQWIEKYEEAVTNHYSPELRARISSLRVNGAHQDLTQVFDPTVHKCRVHAQPPSEVRFLVATAHLQPDTPVIELRGKYMLSTQHRNAGGSLTTRQHSQRPGPFLFFHRLSKDNTEVCVDTRTYGNSARFIRRSCKPNAELRHCIDKGVLHLYIVTTETVDKNSELTIKHESHDLAAIGTAQIPCACGNAGECAVNKTTVKKNGETPEVQSRKRRGRRTVSSSNAHDADTVKQVKEEPPPRPSTPPAPIVAAKPRTPSPVKQMKQDPIEQSPAVPPIKQEPPVDAKKDDDVVPKIEVKMEVAKEEVGIKEEQVELPPAPVDVKKEVETTDMPEVKKEKVKEEMKSSPPPPINTRRSSQYKSDKEDEKCDSKEEKIKSKKLSREERKLEAILRAIEQMEKAESRKQEHKEKQAHRRESEPGPTTPKEEEKHQEGPRAKRRRRKGRARTVSQSARRNRLNSTDSYMTSGDENMLSPNEGHRPPEKPQLKDSPDQNDNRAVGLLLALSNGDTTNKHEKSPPREIDSNSNSAQSSPETQLSSACLLVQAAVEPLEPGFKFPKTKKGLMNEWLNKTPEPIQSASSISPSSLVPHINNNPDDATGFYTPNKNLAALAHAATFCDSAPTRGSAKKRWLRQAISEDHGDSPSSRPDSPPISDMVAPPKKRRLPRESLSNEASPPSTPTGVSTAINDRPEGHVEIVYSSADGDSPTQTLESDAVLKERAAKMKQEFSMIQSMSESLPSIRQPSSGLGCLMDPRLSRDGNMFSGTDLVGTVEKTLSILGFENEKEEKSDTPKRKVKLSITEYRQRKKLTTNDKGGDQDHDHEQTSMEENNSSESFKVSTTPIPRSRAGSTSSSTSLTSSDDDMPLSELPVKAPAFNSEPTELERQRENSSLRLKKVFGLSVDEERRPALNVEAILNLELEPKTKPLPLPSPTFPIPGSDLVREVLALGKEGGIATSVPLQPGPLPSVQEPIVPPPPPKELTPPPPPPPPPEELMDVAEENGEPTVDAGVTNEECQTKQPGEVASIEDLKQTEGDASSNFFYTPDEEDGKPEKEPVNVEESESISYVPPFNNPVYPNDSFTTYTTTMDDDARYEGRNPSPPPDMGTTFEGDP